MTYEVAKKEAEAIMVGPGLRPVSDGDYAVVEEEEYAEPAVTVTSGQMFPDEDDIGTSETHFLYFKRENVKWVRDTIIPAIIPSSDRNYFCNVNRDCIPLAMEATRDFMSQGESAGISMAHITSKEGTDAVKKAFLDKMKAEFDSKYQVTRENFMEFVNKKFEYDKVKRFTYGETIKRIRWNTC
jgi:hypothetical protein